MILFAVPPTSACVLLANVQWDGYMYTIAEVTWFLFGEINSIIFGQPFD
jgi:hypothetical protein